MSWVLKRCGVEQASFDGAGMKVEAGGDVCTEVQGPRELPEAMWGLHEGTQVARA